MNKAALLLLFSGSVFAQQAVIDHCKTSSSDADRIACLESALLGREATDDAASIGESQVIARTQTNEEMLESLEKAEGLIVASYETVPYEKLQVTLDNGQIWRQIKGDTQKLRVDLKRNQTVNISESSLSGYKMQLNEMNRTVRVERIR